METKKIINTSIIGQAYAAMYSGRLKYIVHSDSALLTDKIRVTLSADEFQWKKILEEVATWVLNPSNFVNNGSILSLNTKEGQKVEIERLRK